MVMSGTVSGSSTGKFVHIFLSTDMVKDGQKYTVGRNRMQAAWILFLTSVHLLIGEPWKMKIKSGRKERR